MNKTIVYQSDNLIVTCYNPDKPRLMVSYDRRRLDRPGFPPPNPSKYFRKNDLAFLTIYSAHNDWFLSPDLPDLRKRLSDFTRPYAHITGIGYSMGGYGVLLLARETRVKQVVLVSPQSSVIPAHVPFETRYLQEAAKLDPTLDTLAVNPRKGLRGCLLFDPTHRIDTQHANRITGLFPNIRRVPLPFGGHPAMQVISEVNMYHKVQQELLRQRIRPAEFLRIHKQARRQSPHYQAQLARYLADRAARPAKSAP